jgi:hypothetical protein
MWKTASQTITRRWVPPSGRANRRNSVAKKQTKVAVHTLQFSNFADSTNPSSKIYKSQGPAFIMSCDEIAVEIIFAGRTEQHELLEFRSPPKLVADHYPLHIGVDDIVALRRTRAGRRK